jgi:hypothetical protein
MDTPSVSASLQTLPLDIVANTLVSYLSYSSLLNLSSTSKSLRITLSSPLIWQAFLNHKKYVDITQSKHLSGLPLRMRAAVGGRAEAGWENHTFKAQSLFAQRWQRVCLPRLEISPEFIAVAVGADIQIRWIQNVGIFDKVDRKQWMVYNLGKHGSQDITDMMPLPGLPTEFIIGQADGLIRHLEFSTEDTTYMVKRVFQHPRAIIRSLSTTSEYFVALSSTSSNTHHISFYPLNKSEDIGAQSYAEVCPINTESPPFRETTLPIKDVVDPDFTTAHPTRPWQALFLSPTVLALGSTSPDALCVYDFYPEATHPLQKSRQLLSHPARLSGQTDLPQPNKTSIYAMHQYTPSLLLTGWYHGPANIHDLRLSTQYPVLAMNDPIDDGAVYSVSTDGGTRVLVGGHNHGLIKVFDVRMPSRGWSIYLGRERSPVYAIKAEHSKIFAATEGTVWECDMSYKHKSRKYESGYWRSEIRNGVNWGWGGGRAGRRGWGMRGMEEEAGGGQVRLHYGKEKLYREDGSEIGKAMITGVALH